MQKNRLSSKMKQKYVVNVRKASVDEDARGANQKNGIKIIHFETASPRAKITKGIKVGHSNKEIINLP